MFTFVSFLGRYGVNVVLSFYFALQIAVPFVITSIKSQVTVQLLLFSYNLYLSTKYVEL